MCFCNSTLNLNFLKFSGINLFFLMEDWESFFFFFLNANVCFLPRLYQSSYFQIEALIPQCYTQERMKEMKKLHTSRRGEVPKDVFDCREGKGSYTGNLGERSAKQKQRGLQCGHSHR